jgi:hypothetical protein
MKKTLARRIPDLARTAATTSLHAIGTMNKPSNTSFLSFASIKKYLGVYVQLIVQIGKLLLWPLQSLTKDTIEARRRNLKRVKRLSWWLDAEYRIPFTPWRVGLDVAISSIPGIGWFFGFALSLYIVLSAFRFGIGRVGLMQMMMNVLLDSALGSVPFIGSLGAIAWKANLRNARILEDHLSADLLPEPSESGSWLSRLLGST